MTLITDADSRVCDTGGHVVMKNRTIDQEPWMDLLEPDRTECAHYRTVLSGQPVVSKILAAE